MIQFISKYLKFKDEKGFGLMEVMISVSLMAIVAYGLSTLGNLSNKQQTQTNVTFQVDTARRNIMGTINNPAAWKLTIADSANSTACLISGSCTNGVGGKIYRIHDAGGNVIYDWSGTNGLTAGGTKCSTFNATAGNGSDLCPIQFQVNWTAVCGASCSAGNVQPKVDITAQYNPGTQAKNIAFNSNNYSNSFFQGSNSVACQWDASNGNLVENCAVNVGVNNLAPAHALDVVGDASISVGLITPYVTYMSDARLKTDIQYLDTTQADLNLLRPIRFRWNEKAAESGLTDSEQHLGLLAQDVEKRFPEAVKTAANGTKSVDYALLVVPLIKAVKDLSVENKALKKRVEALEHAR